MTGIIPLPKDEARKLGIESDFEKYLKLQMPKNSYGPSREVGYLQKIYVPAFHTVTVAPFTPSRIPGIRTASDRLKDDIVDFLKAHPGKSPNKLEGLKGRSGPFKATRAEIRTAADELQDEGRVVRKTVDAEQRKRLGIAHQTKQVFECVD